MRHQTRRSTVPGRRGRHPRPCRRSANCSLASGSCSGSRRPPGGPPGRLAPCAAPISPRRPRRVWALPVSVERRERRARAFPVKVNRSSKSVTPGTPLQALPHLRDGWALPLMSWCGRFLEERDISHNELARLTGISSGYLSPRVRLEPDAQRVARVVRLAPAHRRYPDRGRAAPTVTVSIKDTSVPRLPGPRFRTDDSQLITLPVVHLVLLTEGLSVVQLVAGAPARPAGAQRGQRAFAPAG